MSARHLPSVEYLRQCFRHEDGKIFWRSRPRSEFVSDGASKRWNTLFANKEAGYINTCVVKQRVKRYWKIGLRPYVFRRSSLVWVIVKGEWPESMVDHKSRDTLDDRIENLRLATDSQNVANSCKRSNNRSGFKGVWQHKETKRWYAKIVVNSERIFLGSFMRPEDAHAAYCEAARKHFGEFACEGTTP